MKDELSLTILEDLQTLWLHSNALRADADLRNGVIQ